MSLDRLAAERHQDEHKPLGKQLWRSRLQSRDGTRAAKGAKKELDQAQDVAEFLQPSVARARAKSPRIDTSSAQRWPAAVDINHQHSDYRSFQAATQHKINGRERRDKKSLVVRFTTENPEIIGEGGDEAELPPNAVSKRDQASRVHPPLTRETPAAQDPPIALSRVPATATSTSAGIASHGEIQAAPPPLRRAPTGFPLDLEKQHAHRLSPGEGAEKAAGSSSSHLESHRKPTYCPPQTASNQKLAIRERHEKHLTNQPSPSRYLPTSPSVASPVSPLSPSEVALAAKQIFQSDAGLEDSMVSPLLSPDLERYPKEFGPIISAAPGRELSQTRQHYSNSGDGARPNSNAVDAPPYSVAQPTAPGSGEYSQPQKPQTVARLNQRLDGDPTLTNFGRQVEHLVPLFKLTSNSGNRSLSECLLASVWWLLQSRTQVEDMARFANQSSEQKGFQQFASLPMEQAWVNLAKCWWILQIFIPESLPEILKHDTSPPGGRIDRDTEIRGISQNIVNHVRSLVIYAQKNRLFPDWGEVPTLHQRIDTKIWVDYSMLPTRIHSLLSGSNAQHLSHTSCIQDSISALPLGDTEQSFVYGRMFVNVGLWPENGAESTNFSCALSIIRDKTEWQVKVSICSQNGVVNLWLQTDAEIGPTWDDVQWKVKDLCLLVSLQSHLRLVVHLTEKDFKSLWGIYHHAQSFKKGVQAGQDEKKILQTVIKSCQYIDPSKSQNFPAGAISRCRIYLFEKLISSSHGGMMRSSHGGFRLMVATDPELKTLFKLDVFLGGDEPIEFAFMQRKTSDHILKLQARNGDSTFALILAFEQPRELATLWSMLHGGAPRRLENMILSRISLKELSIEPHSSIDESNVAHEKPQLAFQSQHVSMIDEDAGQSGPNFLSNPSRKLRICVDGVIGVLTDRICLGPGELKLRLNSRNKTKVEVLRAAQEEGISICIAENRGAAQVTVDSLLKLQQMMKRSSTIRAYQFHELSDTHHFIQAMTGFSVLYDGVASTFSISRRRMVVPIYKRWEATVARIQVLRHHKVVQLAAFFEQFNYGSCMNFQLKSTDTFETFSKSGKYCLKIVDAKFALPKAAGEEDGEFVCLDLPDYPGEHDDITLAFDNEIDLENFQKVLPAPVSKFSRIGSLRK